MERIGRYFFQHPGLAAMVVACAFLVLGGTIAYVFFRGESTRQIVNREVVESACKTDPRGDECQRILTDSIKAFDRETICVLARKLRIPCERKKGSSEGRSTPPKRDSDAPSTEGTSPNEGSAVEPQPSDPAPGGGGSGGPSGSGGGESPPGDPTPNPPTPTPQPPAPGPDQPTIGSTVDQVIEGVTTPVCDVVKVGVVCGP